MSIPSHLAPVYAATYDHIGIILWGLTKFQRTLAGELDWLARYPHFKIGLDHEAYTYDYLAEHDPQTLQQLRSALRQFAGRLALGTSTYGQPLSMFINEESNIRQLTFAVETTRQRLDYPLTIYLMSEHAFHAQLPQLLLGCGFKGAVLRTHFMMYGHNPEYDEAVGLWQGIDGSVIPALPTYGGQLSAPLLSQRIPGLVSTLDNRILTDSPSPQCRLTLEDFRARFGSRIRPLIATRADDVRNREELIQIHQDDPAYQWIIGEEIFDLLPTPRAHFNASPNDFRVRMPWGYCGNWMWNETRRAEVELLSAERLAAIAAIAPSGGANGDRAAVESDLQQAWKDLLAAQHHDIQICGLEEDARRFLGAALQRAGQVRAACFNALQPDTPFAFNPLPWERIEVVQIGGQSRAVRLAGLALGTPAPFAPASAQPPFTWEESATTEHLRIPGKVLPDQTRERGWSSEVMPCLTTPFYEVYVDPQGGVRLLLDRCAPPDIDPVLLAPPKTSVTFSAMINGADCVSTAQAQEVEIEPECARLLECGEIGGLRYLATLTFYRHTPRIDWRAQVEFAGQWIGRPKRALPAGEYTFERADLSDQIVPAFHEHEYKLRLRFFPRLSPKTWGVRDLPFHIAETDETYVQGNYWTAVTDGRLGLALLNRGLMGSVRESDGAFSSILAFSLPYIWGTRVLRGAYTYELGILPFRGDWRAADIHRQALAYNFPFVLSGAAPAATATAWSPYEERGDGKAILSALYTRSGSTYARFYEPRGEKALVAFDWLGKPARLTAVDLRERVQGRLGERCELSPWQVQTFKIN